MFRRHFFMKQMTAFLAMIALASSLHAGPNEDYEAGLKSYRDGDVVGAMAPLKKAADAGHTQGMVLYAEVLNRAEFSDEALQLYKKAAELGDPDGMLGYGTMLANGDASPDGRRKNKNPKEARIWIEKAAEMGHEHSTKVLAQSYLRAELGFTPADRDTPQALKWVEKAAALDFVPAVEALYRAYQSGGMLTLSPNAKLAAQYLAQANRLMGLEGKKAKKRTRKQIAAEAAAMEEK